VYLQDKDLVNKDNQYGHNFRGLYCTCNRPYPDPEDEVRSEWLRKRTAALYWGNEGRDSCHTIHNAWMGS